MTIDATGVDAVAVAFREHSRVARGLGEADQQQPYRRDDDGRVVVGDDRACRQIGPGETARDVADERDSVGAEVE
ncbi:MAG TPA: hypothetical protein VHS03_07390 [Gaiellaceae bacterium]|nr:hypothetical protein [Gaiellaceae bacterium]